MLLLVAVAVNPGSNLLTTVSQPTNTTISSANADTILAILPIAPPLPSGKLRRLYHVAQLPHIGLILLLPFAHRYWYNIPALPIQNPKPKTQNGMNLLHVIQRYYPYIGGSEQYFQEVSERFARDGNRVRVFTTDAWDIEHFWSAGKRRITPPQSPPSQGGRQSTSPPVGGIEGGFELHNGVEISRYPVRRLPLVSPIFYPVMRRAMAEISRLPGSAGLLMQMCRSTPLVPALARALHNDRERVDLIHATNIPFDSLIYHSYRYARRRGIPFVVTPFTHLGEPDDTRVRKYYTMRHQLAMEKAAAAVIVATNLERDYLAERGVDPRKMHRVGIGVNPEQAQGGNGAAFRAKYNLGDRPIVFSVGVTAYDKGTVHLVEAMRRLWARGGEAELVLAGATMSHFMNHVASVPEQERTRLHVLGPVSDEDKRGLFAAGDVFAMPSRTDSFGIVYLEAWLYGKPVIGAQAGGVPEVINANRDGLLVRFGDVEALAAAIDRLLTDKPLAAAFGAAGRRKVLSGMTWDDVYRNMDAVYSELVKRGG